ncbi:hypothetical protein GTO27_04500, partial [Candidatus Bathyarchaeota archaeon]|nr:hypothetical protein [Candidatus Bathyarchaeota archaeon]
GKNEQDFDLYIKYGSRPTTSSYDARGYTSSANEVVEFGDTESGWYYIMIRSYRGSGNYLVEAYYPLTSLYLEIDYLSGYEPRTDIFD